MIDYGHGRTRRPRTGLAGRLPRRSAGRPPVPTGATNLTAHVAVDAVAAAGEAAGARHRGCYRRRPPTAADLAAGPAAGPAGRPVDRSWRRSRPASWRTALTRSGRAGARTGGCCQEVRRARRCGSLSRVHAPLRVLVGSLGAGRAAGRRRRPAGRHGPARPRARAPQQRRAARAAAVDRGRRGHRRPGRGRRDAPRRGEAVRGPRLPPDPDAGRPARLAGARSPASWRSRWPASSCSGSRCRARAVWLRTLLAEHTRILSHLRLPDATSPHRLGAPPGPRRRSARSCGARPCG